jgi:hypothetical protein
MDNIFDILLQYGNPKLAIRYAKRIIEENKGKTPAMIAPGTKVYELVEELAKYLPEDIKVKFLYLFCVPFSKSYVINFFDLYCTAQINN